MKVTFKLFLILLVSLNVLAQNKEGFLELKGKVLSDQTGMDSVKIEVFEYGNLVKSKMTSSKGCFLFKLHLNKTVDVVFSKKGFVTKKVFVDSHVEENQEIWSYSFDVKMIKMMQGLDVSFFNQPIAKISFKDEEAFIYDLKYADSIAPKLVEIQKNIELLKRQEYSLKIAQADKAFNENNYHKAISAYEEALLIDSYAHYAENQILICEKKLNSSEKEKLKYDKLIKLADQDFNSSKYNTAKKKYTSALELYPKEAYPKSQLDKIAVLLPNAVVELVRLKGRVLEGKSPLDSVKVEVFESGKVVQFVYASSSGRFVLKFPVEKQIQIVFSKQGYASKKIFMNTHVETKKNLWSYSYNIELFKMQQDLDISALNQPVEKIYYDSKKAKFVVDKEYSKEIKPKLAQINKAIENLTLRAYDQKIAQADAMFNQKKYKDAIRLYEEAIDIDPYTDYPDRQIILSVNKLRNEKQDKSKYQKYIALADDAFVISDYSKSKKNYQLALGIFPQETYPQEKLSELDVLIAEKMIANKNINYKRIIVEADDFFNKKQYQKALGSYRQAADEKPNEQYPQDRISKIEGLLAAIKEQSKKDAMYQEKIASADSEFKKERYSTSQVFYQEALGIKPDEIYPKEQLSKIESKLSDLAEQEQIEKAYKELVSQGDAKFKVNSYEDAKEKYQLALNKKPSESYPAKQIAEIDKRLFLLAEQKTIDTQYSEAITNADNFFNSKLYDKAKDSYSKALGVKPKESYPKKKIVEIDRLLAQMVEKQEQKAKYDELIAKADKKLSDKKYQEAISDYQSAQKILIKETYPKNQIEKINGVLFAQKKEKERLEKVEKTYQAKMVQADGLLVKKDYVSAKKAYQVAIELKPNESYPKIKILEINHVLSQLQKEEQYANSISKAKELLVAKKYEQAKFQYEKALELKPLESYPKEKIQEIDNLIAKTKERARRVAKYNEIIERADQKFDQQQYIEAKRIYKEATLLNKKDLYPQNRIDEITNLLIARGNATQKVKQEEEKEQRYKKLLAIADGMFNKENYSGAKEKYKIALILYSKRAYPKEKIQEIDKLLEGIKSNIPEEIDFSNAQEKQKFISEMASKYGEGVHEENYEAKSGKKVRRIIVVSNGIADEYREVKQPWGAIFFFKNGKSINQSQFSVELKID